MSSTRIKRVNKHIQRTFSTILHTEARLPAQVLVTVSAVDTVPNLRSATVWLSVFPIEHGEAVIAELTQQLYDLQGSFNRALQMRPLPRLHLRLDTGADYAARIERKLAQLATES